MRVTFQEVKLYAQKTVKCAGGCGRTIKRQRKFYETLNPFNQLPDGSIKGREDIDAELRELAKKWKALPVTCKHCEGGS